MSERRTDVLIVGAGIIGLSVAYHLRSQGDVDVLVLEKEEDIGLGSSSLCAGGIRHQFGIPQNVKLSIYSTDFFSRLEELSGRETGYRQNGYLFAVREAVNLERFREMAEMMRGLGLEVEVLAPGEIKERFPFVETSDLAGGTFCKRDGYMDPHSVLQSLYRLDKEIRVRFSLGERVLEIVPSGPRDFEVVTEKGRIRARYVVNAAGPYAGEVAKLAGLEIPVEPYRRQIFITDRFPHIPDNSPMVVDYEKHWYGRMETGSFMFGMSNLNERPGFNTSLDYDFMEEMVNVAIERIPALEKAGISRGWAGLYAITPDHNPIIEESPELGGFVQVCGFSGHGFMHAPGAGKLAAEIILNGRTSLLNEEEMGVFSSSRFKEAKISSERLMI